jgi:hypothetical protein
MKAMKVIVLGIFLSLLVGTPVQAVFQPPPPVPIETEALPRHACLVTTYVGQPSPGPYDFRLKLVVQEPSDGRWVTVRSRTMEGTAIGESPKLHVRLSPALVRELREEPHRIIAKVNGMKRVKSLKAGNCRPVATAS